MNRLDGVRSEAAILVGVILPDHQFEDDSLDELAGLARTAGSHVVGRITQRRQVPDAATYLGKGKVEELGQFAEANDADVILFDNDLSPGQTRNLESATGIKVLDRSELILDIFATRAQTNEARLAVELTQLEYSLPKLKRMWSHLSRIKNGIGMRGPGEKQLEVDRRLVEKKISDLRRELAVVQARKQRTVAARNSHRTVSLVGYTNAGKSTLMNRLTQAGVLAEDKLFATLDTRTRRWQLPGWGPVLLSDTVGFIRDLPHGLIASFKATLEEARQADLLLHVADASNPAALEQISAVYGVLEEIGIQEKDTLLVLNKIDGADRGVGVAALMARYPHAIRISARTGDGVGNLAHEVSDALSRPFIDVDVETDAGNGRLLAYLSRHGEVLSQRYQENRVTVHCRIPAADMARITQDDVTVRPHHLNQHLNNHGHQVAIGPAAALRPDLATPSNGHASGNGQSQ
ncbi:MAG: GTPase HflX [Planctomycetia bacterium]|nr:GTPase HflX [Planctomycetia bacterium]